MRFGLVLPQGQGMRLVDQLEEQFAEGARLEAAIRRNLQELDFGR
jgi:hypothetical protein